MKASATPLRRLFVTLALVASVVVVAGIGTLLLRTSRLRAELDASISALLTEQRLASRIRAGVARQLLNASLSLSDSSTETAAQFRSDGEQVFTDLSLYLARDLSREQRALAERLKNLYQAFTSIAEDSFVAHASLSPEASRERAAALRALSRRIDTTLDQTTDLRASSHYALEARQVRHLGQLYLLLTLFGIVVVATLFAGVRTFDRRVLRPLAAIRAVTGRIGLGDFDARVSIATRDELGEVADSVNRMAAGLASLRAAEEALRATEEQLRQSQKMEAIGRLAGGIAHDFNNLLTVVSCNTELALEQLDEGHAAREELDGVRAASRRGAELTRQLLAFSRKQVLQPELVELNQVVRETAAMLHRLLEENVRLDVETSPGSVRVVADRGQIAQVILNLVINARDAMPEGGVIRVATAVESRDDGGTSRDVALLTVEDNGMGMSAETQERIFEPFFTTKDTGKGTGLGLSTVYGIVRQSGGTIAVRSAPGEGTTFTLALPIGLEAVSRARTPSGSPAIRAVRPRIIIVADNDQSVRQVAARLLRQLGAHVLEASTGAEALAAAASVNFNVDVLVTDVGLSVISGHDVAMRLRERMPGLRVVYSTNQDIEAEVWSQMAAGDSVLTKPFQPRELEQRVFATP